MGLSYRWHSDRDEQSACDDHCVCTSGNVTSGNGHSNAPVIHHTPSEYSYSTNNICDGNTADEEERVITKRFQYQIFREVVKSNNCSTWRANQYCQRERTILQILEEWVSYSFQQ